MEIKFLKKKYQEKWENAYLTVPTPSLQSNVSAN